jgi:hypothetical protein
MMRLFFQILRWAFSKDARILSIQELNKQLRRQQLIALGEYGLADDLENKVTRWVKANGTRMI